MSGQCASMAIIQTLRINDAKITIWSSIILHGLPNDLIVDPEILMRKQIAHVCHIPTGDFGVFSIIFLGTCIAVSPMISKLASFLADF